MMDDQAPFSSLMVMAVLMEFERENKMYNNLQEEVTKNIFHFLRKDGDIHIRATVLGYSHVIWGNS